MLVSKLPASVKVTFGARITNVTQTADKATLHYDQLDAEGKKIREESFEADACIGADGFKSVVRTSLWPNLKDSGFSYTGTYVYRALM